MYIHDMNQSFAKTDTDPDKFRLLSSGAVFSPVLLRFDIDTQFDFINIIHTRLSFKKFNPIVKTCLI